MKGKVQCGNITAAGVCAHESDMKNGEPVKVLLFDMTFID